MDDKFIAPIKERQLFEDVSSFYRGLIITKEKEIENLKRSNRMLENKIHKQRKELNRLNKENKDLKEEIGALTRELYKAEDHKTKLQDEISKLRDKVDSLKEERKHLLQDKNAVINLTKGFLDDTIDHTTYEVYGLLQNYYKKLIELNLGSNDSNTKTYLELKHSNERKIKWN